jgi:hypothetical protein
VEEDQTSSMAVNAAGAVVHVAALAGRWTLPAASTVRIGGSSQRHRDDGQSGDNDLHRFPSRFPKRTDDRMTAIRPQSAASPLKTKAGFPSGNHSTLNSGNGATFLFEKRKIDPDLPFNLLTA